ncbi:hypothetical protein [Erwinia sp. 198]|uniref:hypothetical protein n=1 Tax=Erwinia sp. 198 TaxID=2022746 RepID=UPI0011CFAF7F|nr:hypothetical protein [Erwinia sp. 198]
MSWQVQYKDKIETHYKSNNFKAEDIKDNQTSELIERNFIQNFFDITLPNYHTSPYRKEIKNGINCLTIRRKSVVELTFLSYFQALESLVLAYKRQNGIEFILDKVRFGRLRSKLEETIKKELPLLKKERGKIYNKINELNRLSFKESAMLFLDQHSIEIGDTWPLFDDKKNNTTGLTTIRNVLIHGDLLPSDQLINIAIASEHLRTILIRCIFSLLGWELSKTKFSKKFIFERHHLFNPKVKNKAIYELNSYFK